MQQRNPTKQKTLAISFNVFNVSYSAVYNVLVQLCWSAFSWNPTEHSQTTALSRPNRQICSQPPFPVEQSLRMSAHNATLMHKTNYVN